MPQMDDDLRFLWPKDQVVNLTFQQIVEVLRICLYSVGSKEILTYLGINFEEHLPDESGIILKTPNVSRILVGFGIAR